MTPIPRFEHTHTAHTMSSKKIAKTNAARLLERLEIPFTLHQADVDESDLSAVTMARKLGVDPGCVFKWPAATGQASSWPASPPRRN